MINPDASLLRDLVSKLKLSENPTKFLSSKLNERALSTYNAEQIEQKPHHGIPCKPQICATESDVDVSETHEKVPPDSSLELYSGVVDQLLPVLKSDDVVGRDVEKKLLLSQLLSPDPRRPQLSLIPIAGMAGIGKTTLARLIFDHRTVQEHFELKAWVKIEGQDHHNQNQNNQLFDIARKLLKSATGMLCSFNNEVEVYEMVVDTLLSRRSLIVLDDFDFMDMELWQQLKDSWFRFVGLGSKVVIITRKLQLAASVAGTPFYLGELSQVDSWSLYISLASSSLSKETQIFDDDGDARWLAARCKGVPLSLKLLGCLMRFEEINCSPNLMAKMANFLDPSMVLSMAVLALPSDLFNCFAYCGIFPYGYVLDKAKLIKMWIADDLVKVKPSKSLEDVGEAYFHQLICRSFFTDITCNEYGDIVQARMPSDVHILARKIAGFVSRDKVAYAFGVDANSSHLSLALPFQKVYNPKTLQTLVSFHPNKHHHPLISSIDSLELKHLTSLDLTKSGIRKLSKHICMLRKLKYLNLSQTLLTKLPKSFTTLTRLQTLDLSRCYYLKYLPKKMSNLSKLRHLDLSQCNSLCYTPSGIGRLHSLITMSLYVLGEERDSKCSTLAELHKLNELRGVLAIINLENVTDISEAQAADLKEKKLHHLGLSWSLHKVDECSHEVLEYLKPTPQLRVLELRGYGGHRFPSWMPNLRCLVKLLIIDCRCKMLPKLGDLKLLKELELKDLINIKTIGQEFYTNGNGDGEGDIFPSLEKLKLDGMPKLRSWSNADIAQGSNDHQSSVSAFRRLKKLTIQNCPELRSLPTLPSLTELVVWRSNGEILPFLTRTKSLTSIVINDMDVKKSLQHSSSLNSVEKLIVVHSSDLDVLESFHINKFTSLQHLRILHCLKLVYVKFPRLGSLEKLNVVDCQNLNQIDLVTEESTLTELIIEDCPQLATIHITRVYSDSGSGSGSNIRKMIVKNCPNFSISPEKIEELRGLEFLFITGCPKMK